MLPALFLCVEDKMVNKKHLKRLRTEIKTQLTVLEIGMTLTAIKELMLRWKSNDTDGEALFDAYKHLHDRLGKLLSKGR
jgi:hypothetical protein